LLTICIAELKSDSLCNVLVVMCPYWKCNTFNCWIFKTVNCAIIY